MSERTTAAMATLVVACLLLVPGTPLRAQSERQEQNGQVEAALLRHLDSILPAFNAATRAERAAEARWRAEADARAAARARGLLDTISVGPLRIVTHRAQERLAHELFADVWSQYQPQVHGSPVFAHTLFTFQWSVEPHLIPVQGDVGRVQMPRWDSRASVEDRIRAVVGLALEGDLLSTRVGRTWRPGPVRPVEDAADVYRDLAATPSKINRSCLDGDVHACAQALGLEVEADSWKSWYTPQDVRYLVLGFFGYDRRTLALQHACGNGSDSACERLLGILYDRPGEVSIGTLSVEARQSLLWLALQRGGAGAWARLLNNPHDPPAQALSAASGLGVDELVAAWRRWLLKHRPSISAGLPGSMLAAGLWILLFAALAMRSTRWRSR